MKLTMRPVHSSNIAAIGYDPQTRVLAVTFKGPSGTYAYDGVPKEIDDELRDIEAEGGSVGKFFQSAVRDLYPSYRLPLPELAAAE